MSNTTVKKVPTELGTEKVSKLLMQYAIPAIIAQIAASLYNMIDSAFIGHIPNVGPEAISGLATTFPFMNLSAAFGAMVGVGGATQLSVRLGQRDYDSAKNILGNLVTLNIIVGLVFATVSFIFLDDILVFFGASEKTLPFARDFMEVILLGNVVTHLYFGINAALRSSGHPKQAMHATIITVVMNVMLAPIFIFVLGWGIRGAALATILAQCTTLTWQVRLLSNPNELLHLQRGIYKLKSNIVKGILSIGMSPFLINAAACMVVIIINKGLRGNSDNGDLSIAAYGISNRMQFIFVMVVLGLTQGMQPIVGYNYGAKLYGRMIRALKLTAMCATCVMGMLWLFGLIWPEGFIRLFTHDELLIAQSIAPARVMLCTMIMVGFPMVVGNFYTSIGMSGKAIFLSLTRQVILLIPSILLMPLLFQMFKLTPIWGVWWSLPICDAMAAILAAIILNRDMRTFKRMKGEAL